ncbi:hypothetical protein N7G274_000676 [Stereocaulon virgatum]|uniref:Uncharacterized protein n=1 Tax=Stereocaulon virgatum TaxID=373712 RepID=A0ABR4AQ31_9LECA
MFNRGWNSPARRARVPFPKPWQLEANKSYLRTDVTTILAFFVYATSKYVMDGQVTSETLKEFGNRSSVYGIRFASAEVRFEEIPPLPKGGGKPVLVAHLKGSLPETSIPIKLTKKELQNLIAGYPPFYRETFQIRPSALPIPSPIKSQRDAHVRGAWIIAVGISAATISPAVPVYFDPLPNDSSDSVDPCDGFGKPNSPLTRVLNTLKLIKTAYALSGTASEKLNIQATINAVTMMHGTRTESNVKSFIVGTDMDAIVPITLSNRQCEFVLELFSKNVTAVDELGVGDKAMLDPILLQVLYVTLWGAIRVVRYYKDNFNDIRIPELLTRYDRVVYLRDCVDDDDKD